MNYELLPNRYTWRWRRYSGVGRIQSGHYGLSGAPSIWQYKGAHEANLSNPKFIAELAPPVAAFYSGQIFG